MSRRRTRIVLRTRAGPAWAGGGPPEEQPDWDAHAEFIDRLVDQGTIVMAGPYTDSSGTLILLEGVTREQVQAIFADDPFVRNGVFVVEDVRELLVYVDTLGGTTELG
jgi:uncharacterized protein YciI